MSADTPDNADVPPVCHARHPETGNVIMIRRGEPGYYTVDTSLGVEALNACLHPVPTTLQVEAMLIGSMFGWDARGPARRAPEAPKALVVTEFLLGLRQPSLQRTRHRH